MTGAALRRIRPRRAAAGRSRHALDAALRGDHRVLDGVVYGVAEVADARQEVFLNA